jgi:threonine dehydrogenase-like Zn-dependent dehydrogenase
VVTHDSPLTEYRRAYEVAAEKLDKAIKVSMTP